MVSSDFFVLNINLKGENKMGNLIQYIIQEDPDKNEPWQTPALRNNLCERKSTVLSKPKYTNPDPRRILAGEIVKSGLEGFGQGIEGGVEYALNSFTRNLYKRMNDKFLGGIYQKKQDELEKLSKQENLEKPYKYSNYAIDIGVNGAKAFNLIKKGIIKRKRTE